MIGPYTARPHEEVFNSACENFTIPEGRLSELRGYFYGIPYVEVCDIFEAEIILLAKYIFNNEEHTVERMDLPFFATENEVEIKEVFEDRLSLLMIEELYQNEDDYLEAVERGDLKQATIIMSMFRKFTMESRHADSLRNQKNYGLVLNTLLRKTVQRAAVHPAYIHQISRSFAVRIEAARTSSELVTKIFQSMLRKYCGLVNNHSLKNYTLPIRKAINFIDFNYAEQITLDKIAESVSFNYAYLSSQFKKETGSTVIDYINMKRIQKAVTLLSTTTLSIGEIAEKCGFVDDTYFTRVFKKKQGVSPREYRKSIFKN
jgi:YesN/AraC family two-component response regulator